MRTTLKDKETVLFSTRQHWYFMAIPYSVSFIFIFLSIYLYFGTEVSKVVSLILLFLSLVFLIYKIYERKFNIWIVTNLRLIDEEGVFTIRVKESPIDKINNVTYVQSVIGRMLGFGDVEIQTAAEQGATIYKGISLPKELSEALTTAQENYKHNLSAFQPRQSNESFLTDLPGDMIECPYCAEKIKAKAKICRYCGKDLPAAK